MVEARCSVSFGRSSFFALLKSKNTRSQRPAYVQHRINCYFSVVQLLPDYWMVVWHCWHYSHLILSWLYLISAWRTFLGILLETTALVETLNSQQGSIHRQDEIKYPIWCLMLNVILCVCTYRRKYRSQACSIHSSVFLHSDKHAQHIQ